MQNSGSPKPLSPPADCLPGRARSSAPPAGGQPFPTSHCGTCRSAPGRKWPNPGACERLGAFETFPDSGRRATQASLEPPGSLAGARERRRRRGLWETRQWPVGAPRASGPVGERPRQPLWALRPASYQCPRPCREPCRGNVERMLPSVLERVLTPEPLSWGAGP